MDNPGYKNTYSRSKFTANGKLNYYGHTGVFDGKTIRWSNGSVYTKVEMSVPGLHCICQTLYDEKRTYIKCRQCESLYHPECVNYTRGPSIICQPCVKAQKAAEADKKDKAIGTDIAKLLHAAVSTKTVHGEGRKRARKHGSDSDTDSDSDKDAATLDKQRLDTLLGSLTTLKLEGQKIDIAMCIVLCESLSRVGSALKTLDLSDNPIGFSCSTDLATYLSNDSCQVTTLTVGSGDGQCLSDDTTAAVRYSEYLRV